MFLLRRTATRVIASTPSTTLFPKTRSIGTYRLASFLPRPQNSIVPALRRSYASDPPITTEPTESRPTEATESADEAAVEAEENFAQTAAEAPIEENLTPAQQKVQSEPTDRLATVDSSALDAAAVAPKASPSSEAAENSSVNSVLYVGNLFYEVTAAQLQRVFSRFGEVVNTRVVYDNRGLSRGFAYVEFSTPKSAQDAIASLDMQVFEGRNLVVQLHKPRTSGPNQKKQMPPSETLFIGNMSYDMSDKDLNDLFRDIRNVTDVRVAIDRRTGQPRGFAHADFIDVASALKAKEILDGKEVFGRKLRIDFGTGFTARNRPQQDGQSFERRGRSDGQNNE